MVVRREGSRLDVQPLSLAASTRLRLALAGRPPPQNEPNGTIASPRGANETFCN